MLKNIYFKTFATIFLITMLLLPSWGPGPLAFNSERTSFIEPEIFINLAKEEFVPVIVFLTDPLHPGETKNQYGDDTGSAATVAHALQERARAVLKDAKLLLAQEIEQGNIKGFRSLWIVNAFAASINQKALLRLAELPQVKTIRPDRSLTFTAETTVLEPEETADTIKMEQPEQGLIPWNLQLINAPAVWQEGYTGKNTVIAVMDTGVDPEHPALQDKYRGDLPGHSHATSWFDVPGLAAGIPVERPRDPYGHGTYVTGIILGGSLQEPMGVAPGAKWIAVNIFEDGTTWDSYITQAFQWLLAPGGDPQNAPQIINCSWASRPEYVSDYLQWEVLHTLEQAGIFVVFAAGNNSSEGPGSPASYPHAFSAGALTKTEDEIEIAPFSSCGPVNWQGISYIKPEITAPGMNVRSAWTGGGHNVLDGTSTAAAHVSGSAALLLEARPGITPSELAYSLKRTASWLPSWNAWGEKPNGTYGYGLLDTAAAVQSAKLNPPELIFFDGADEGITNWSTSPSNPWKITREKVYEGAFAFADSPWDHYHNNAASWLALSEPISLCGYHDPVLTFQHYYDLARGEKREDDYGIVEISTDGRNWTRLYRFTGSSGEYIKSSISLKLPAEAQHFFLRFRLQSNGNGPGVGWYIDDIRVTARPQPLFDLQRLVIVPEKYMSGINGVTKVSAKAYFSQTHYRPVDPELVEWRSTNPEVARIRQGLVKAISPGVTEIEGTFAGHTSRFSLEVIEVPSPAAFPAPGILINNTTVELEAAKPGLKIYYTLDGSEPDQNSNLYENPLFINETTEIKARAYLDDIPGNTACFFYTIKEGSTVRGSLQLQHLPFNRDIMELYIVCQAEGNRYNVFTLDEEGDFNIELPLGRYKLVAKYPQHLAVVKSFELAKKDEHILSCLLLLAGDINNDNRIDLMDLARLSLAYGTMPGDENWNPRADINGDGRVDISDLTILTRNYGMSTPQIP